MSSTAPTSGMLWIAVLALAGTSALADDTASPDSSRIDARPSIAPDIRDDQTKMKMQKGDIVVVPIPMSNPTLDTGLVLGGAYFYAQTEEQAKEQPASVTAAAGMYTSNDSKAFGIVQQNYWREDRWRFTGALAMADLRLTLLAPDGSDSGSHVDYKVSGPILFAQLSRRLKGDWYGGVQMRVIQAKQGLEVGDEDDSTNFEFDDVVSSGLGLNLEYDSRDLPMNSYDGGHTKITALFNDEAIGSNQTYQSYSIFTRAYRSLTKSVVLAWEAQGCHREGKTPLWDSCTVKLRGFPATDYLGVSSASTQIEARWKMSKRWGLVGFAGVGTIEHSFSGVNDHSSIPSYGVGVRFMVLQSKRINMRVDYARSDDSDAIYLSVGEAF